MKTLRTTNVLVSKTAISAILVLLAGQSLLAASAAAAAAPIKKPVANTQPAKTIPVKRAAITRSAQAKPAVNLTSTVFIERTEKNAAGVEKKVLKTPAQISIVPGDRVIFILDYINQGTEPAAGFQATNPIPGPIQFTSVREDWAEVSVDSGVNWGKLTALSVSDGSPVKLRPANAADVTHVRWIFPAAIEAGKKGSLSYTGVVK